MNIFNAVAYKIRTVSALIPAICLLGYGQNACAGPDAELIVTSNGPAGPCCYSFTMNQTGGENCPNGLSSVTATVTGGAMITSASSSPGSPSQGSATVVTSFPSQSVTWDTCFDDGAATVEICFDNVPASGATVTFSAATPFLPGPFSISTNGCAQVSCLQITCPTDITVPCDGALGSQGAFLNFPMPTVSSSCPCSTGTISVTASWPSGSGSQQVSDPPNSTVYGLFPNGVTPVTITAVDGCGNMTSCEFSITVVGQGPPAGTWALADGTTSGEPANALQEGRAIAVDENGNILVGGVFTGTATFAGVGNASVKLTASGSDSDDGFLVKYNSDGELLWAEQTGCCSNAQVNSVAVDSQGNCLVTGRFQGCAFAQTALYENTFCGAIYSLGAADMFLAKYDPSGNLLWAASAGDVADMSGTTDGQSVAMDANDNCYVTGLYGPSLGIYNGFPLCPSSYPAVSLIGTGAQDAYLAKFDSNGTLVWVTGSTCISSGDRVSGRGVAVGVVNGTTYAWLVGTFNSSTGIRFEGQPAGGLSTDPAGFENAFVLEYSGLGNSAPTVSWIKQVTSGCASGVSNNAACGIQDGRQIGVDANGNCYFTAYFNGSATLGALTVYDNNPVGPPYSFAQDQLYDYLVASIDFSGNPRWIVNGGLYNDNESRALAVTPAGNVFVTGEYGADAQFDSGGQSVMLLEYDSNGGYVRAETGLGTLGAEVTEGLGVAVDAAGCFYVTGGFDEQGPPVDSGLVFQDFTPQKTLAAAKGQQAMFVVKYCPLCSGGGVSGCVEPPPNMVLWLPFDEAPGAGTLGNLASSAHPGTPTGSPGSVSGKVAGALSFNNSQYVAVPDYSAIEIGTGDVTVDAWITRSSTDPNSPPTILMDKRDVNTYAGYLMGISYGHVIFQISGANYEDNGPVTIPADGSWHLIAVTISQTANTASFYIDGARDSVVAITPSSMASTQTLWIGNTAVGGSLGWIGNIDEFEIFNRALSDGEIKGIFDAGASGKCKPACYPGSPNCQITAQASFDSMQNTALGNATSSQSGGILNITNLGISGLDGLGISSYDLSGLQSVHVAWAPLDPISALPSGAALTVNAIGTGGPITNGTLGWLRTAKVGASNYSVTASFPSAGTNTVSVRAYSGPTLVGEADGLSGTIATMPQFPQITENGTGPYNPLPPYDYLGGGPVMKLAWTAPVSLAIGSGFQVLADSFVVVPDRANRIASMSSIQLLTSNLTELEITNESSIASYGGLAHMSLGEAIIVNTNTSPYITNLGSGGQDGLSISFPPNLTEWSWYLSNPDASNVLADGAYLSVNVMGSFGTVSNTLLGSFSVFKAGTSNYLLSADFTSIGVTNYTVIVSNGATQTGEVSGVTDAIAAALPSITISFHLRWGPPFRVWFDDKPDSITVDPVGAALHATGDTVTMIPEGLGVNAAPSSLQLLASGIPSLAILSETVSPLVLKSTPVNGNLSLQWFGAGVLQQSADLNSWADITNSASPYSVTNAGSSRFYRIRQPIPAE